MSPVTTPLAVYRPRVYLYPPIAYPPPGYYTAGMVLLFAIGVAMA